MRISRLFIAFLVLVIFFFTVGFTHEDEEKKEETEMEWTFENVPVGKLPAGWKVEATNPHGPLSTWQVITDPTAPSGTHVLALTDAKNNYGNTYNLCWTNQVHFLNGTIEVQFKANKGKEDQGGGVIWRAQDRNNYYIARFNPLENNFRIYYVKNSVRRMIATTRIALPAHKWHELKITHIGNKITGYLNGKKLLEVTDRTFQKAGGVGLWTKADAATAFDNFEVEMENEIDED